MAKIDLLIKHGCNEDDVINLVFKTAMQQANCNEVRAIFDLYPIENYPNLYEWLKLVYNLIAQISTYANDTQGREQIKTPERFLFIDKCGDCDDYTTLWATILSIAKILFLVKLVKYDLNENWAHVYIIVPTNKPKQYITLDNVNPAGFNKEVSYVQQKLYKKN